MFAWRALAARHCRRDLFKLANGFHLLRADAALWSHPRDRYPPFRNRIDAGPPSPRSLSCLDKFKADQNFVFDTLKVDATPIVFINGERLRGAMSFEDLDQKTGSLLKRQPDRPPCNAVVFAALQRN